MMRPIGSWKLQSVFCSHSFSPLHDHRGALRPWSYFFDIGFTKWSGYITNVWTEWSRGSESFVKLRLKTTCFTWGFCANFSNFATVRFETQMSTSRSYGTKQVWHPNFSWRTWPNNVP